MFFFFSTGLTVIYSFRLINFCLQNFLGFIILNINEELLFFFPIRFLLIISIFGGSILIWLIFPFYNLIILNFFIKILTLLICLFGVILGYYLFNVEKFKNLKIIKFQFFFSLMWFIPIIFCYFLNYYLIKILIKYKIFIDYGWLEYLGGSFFLKFPFFFIHLKTFNKKLLFLLFLSLLIII